MPNERLTCPKCRQALYLSGTLTFVCTTHWWKDTRTNVLTAWVDVPKSTNAVFRCSRCDGFITTIYEEAARIVGAKEGKYETADRSAD